MTLSLRNEDIETCQKALVNLDRAEKVKSISTSDKFDLRHNSVECIDTKGPGQSISGTYIRVPISLTHEDCDDVSIVKVRYAHQQYDSNVTKPSTMAKLFDMLIMQVDDDELRLIGNDTLKAVKRSTGVKYTEIKDEEFVGDKYWKIGDDSTDIDSYKKYKKSQKDRDPEISSYADEHTFEISIDADEIRNNPDDYESYIYEEHEKPPFLFNNPKAKILDYDGGTEDKAIKIECLLPDESIGKLHYSLEDDDTSIFIEFLEASYLSNAPITGVKIREHTIERLPDSNVPVVYDENTGKWVVDLEKGDALSINNGIIDGIVAAIIILLFIGAIPVGLLYLLGAVSTTFAARYAMAIVLLWGIISLIS